MERAAGLFLVLLLSFVSLVEAQQRHALLIGGLGGSQEYTAQFRQYLFDTRSAMVEELGFEADNVMVLAERAIVDEDFVDDVSTAENIRARFDALAHRVGEGDQVYVVLFGHGSYDGTHAQLNIPRRDLDDTAYGALVDGLGAARVVFINTASASAPFVAAVSGPGRVVVTATRAGTQRNETTFPRFFVEALTSPAADLDKDGSLSMREVFVYTSQQTARSYETEGHLATEHALLDDDGDGEGSRVEEMEQNGDGSLAAVTYLRRSEAVAATGASSGDPAEKDALERAIAELISRKQEMAEDRYYAELETLFVKLARLNEGLEQEEE